MADLKVNLGNYYLHYDGTIEPKNPEKIHEFLLFGIHPNKIAVSTQTEDVKLYNSLVDEPHERVKTEINESVITTGITPDDYQIPEPYRSLDLEAYIFEVYRAKLNGKSESIKEVDRIHRELEEIKKREVEDLFRTIIFVVDEFKRTNTVFGVGRGSSCACYILFLIGLNLVNPLKFNIPMEEFFHD